MEYKKYKHIIKKYQRSKKGRIAFARANAKNKYGISGEVFNNIIKNGCMECGFNEYILDFHHLDKDKLNNTLENLRYLCPNCHQRLHRLEKLNCF